MSALPGRDLTPEHREYLVGEGIAAAFVDDLAARGHLRSAATGDPRPDGFRGLSETSEAGLWFAFPKGDESIRWQLRPDNPDGGPKYRSGRGESLGYGLRRRGASNIVLVIEGTKQSLAGAAAVAAITTFAGDVQAIADATVIGVPGCWGWSEEGDIPLDLQMLCRGRKVIVMPDADAWDNETVYEAFSRFGKQLTLAAEVKFAAVPGGGKTGLDDVLAQVEVAERPSLLAAIVAAAQDKPAAVRPPKKRPKIGYGLPVDEASVAVQEKASYDEIARLLIENHFMHPTERVPVIAFDGGIWWRHLGPRWTPMAEGEMAATVWRLLAEAVVVPDADASHGRTYEISTHRRDNVMAGLKARLATDPSVRESTSDYWMSWRGGRWVYASDPVGPVIACANGLLARRRDADTGDRAFYSHTPRYWNASSIAVSYDPEATNSEALTQLLTSAWPDDVECQNLALEILGYVASGATDLQKILYPWGPKRAGKGLMLQVMTDLVGEAMVEASGFSEMSVGFGLETWIGKSLAILDDARGEKVDVGLLSRRMLSISGGAATPVQRKNQPNWSGVLPTRIVITSNMLVDLRDPAGVIASRFVVLPFSRGFFGVEDRTLPGRLRAQMPAIFNLALAAYDRLMGDQDGRFTQPAAAEMDHVFLRGSQSAELAFLEDCAILDPDSSEEKSHVYRVYRQWAQDTGHKAKSDTVFFRDLYSATERQVRPTRPSSGGDRTRLIGGLRLLDDPLLGSITPPGPGSITYINIPDGPESDSPDSGPGSDASVRGPSGVRPGSGPGSSTAETDPSPQVSPHLTPTASSVGPGSGDVCAKKRVPSPPPEKTAVCPEQKHPGHPGPTPDRAVMDPGSLLDRAWEVVLGTSRQSSAALWAMLRDLSGGELSRWDLQRQLARVHQLPPQIEVAEFADTLGIGSEAALPLLRLMAENAPENLRIYEVARTRDGAGRLAPLDPVSYLSPSDRKAAQKASRPDSAAFYVLTAPTSGAGVDLPDPVGAEIRRIVKVDPPNTQPQNPEEVA